jgi:hypothetical protein
MRKLEKLRAYIQQPERRAPRKKKSEAAQQDAAKLMKRKIQAVRKAQEMLRRVEELTTAGRCPSDLRLLRDELVEALFSLRNAKRDVKGMTARILQ